MNFFPLLGRLKEIFFKIFQPPPQKSNGLPIKEVEDFYLNLKVLKSIIS